MMHKELNEKLARWAGFKTATPTSFARGWHKCPDETLCQELPNFTESLDACEKWLILKLDSYQISRASGHRVHCAQVWGDMVIYTVADESPALALCKAVEKLIDA